MMLFLVIHCVIGVSIISKAELSKTSSETVSNDFIQHGAKARNRTRARESYIPVVLRRSEGRIEARIPVLLANRSEAVRGRKRPDGKERPVPIIRGIQVPLREDLQDLPSNSIEGLNPPSQTAPETWQFSQRLQYPDSNGYYPNVGDSEGGYSTTLRPVYGVPTQGSSWMGCMAPAPWGQPANPSPNRPNYPNDNSYPTRPGQYPPSSGYNPNNYPSSGYPPQGPPPSSNYPSQGGRPPSPYPSQGGPPPSGYPTQGGYPPSQVPPSSGYPSQVPPSSGYPQDNPYNYPHSGSNRPGVQGQYPENGWNTGSQQSSWNYPGRPWKTENHEGRWVPCGPFDLNDGRRRTYSGCPQARSSMIRFENEVIGKIDDKNFFEDKIHSKNQSSTEITP